MTDSRNCIIDMDALKSQTLGTLKNASAKVTMPSTLSYKERRALAEHDPVEYHRYASAANYGTSSPIAACIFP
jgi:hypothetical protein